MDTKSIIASFVLCMPLIGGTVYHGSKPFLPNLFGYETLGWQRGSRAMLTEYNSYRRYSWQDFRRLRYFNHYKVKLNKGQTLVLDMKGDVIRGRVTGSIYKVRGYFEFPTKLDHFKHAYLKHNTDPQKQVTYVVPEDGYYRVNIDIIADLSDGILKHKVDYEYEAAWRIKRG